MRLDRTWLIGSLVVGVGCGAASGNEPPDASNEVADATASKDGNVATVDDSGGDDGSANVQGNDGATADQASDSAYNTSDAAPESGAGCSTTCASGCCDSSGQCVPYANQSPTACGTGGVACVPCSTDAGTGATCSGGSCVCAGGTVCAGSRVCCGSSCANLQSDGYNCGSCGHDCLGGGCVGGLCQPVVLGAVTPGTNAHALTVDASNVYFGNNQTVFTCPLSGCPGAASTFFSLPGATPYAAGLHYDAATATIFLSDGVGGKIYSLTTSGSTNWTLPLNVGSPGAIVTDSTNVYWGEYQGIYKAPKSGGTATAVCTFASIKNYFWGVALDPGTNSIFAAVRGISPTGGYLIKCPLSGGAPSNLPTATDGYAVAVVGQQVFGAFAGTSPRYYADGGLNADAGLYPDAGFFADAGFYAASTTTFGDVTPVAVGSEYANATAATADDTYVYFGTAAGETIYKCVASNCAGTFAMMTPSMDVVENMVNDSVAVYWTGEFGSVYRVAK